MARRKRVDVPSAEALAEVEAGFEVKSAAARPAPIAQIAAEAAVLSQPISAEDRTDAEHYRAAAADGRLITELAIKDIVVDELTRDRAVVDAEAMEELKASIKAHGVRMPIDVYARDDGRYALISGFRRLLAAREVIGAEATIRAAVRKPEDLSAAYVAMVEENEVRADLSHYERGRIAALASEQGAYADVAEAVATLFAAGSKAKRSKIRSFAVIHEELGDVLAFPAALGERLGLRVAGALKAGQGGALRDALAEASPGDAPAEERTLMDVLKRLEGATERVSRAKPSASEVGETIALANGITMRKERDARGFVIRLDGVHVDDEFVETVMSTVGKMLDAR